EGNEDLVSAPVAAESGEATCHDATGEKLAKLPLDEGGQALAVAAGPRFLEEGLEVLAEHDVEHRRPRGAGARTSESYPRAGCRLPIRLSAHPPPRGGVMSGPIRKLRVL